APGRRAKWRETAILVFARGAENDVGPAFHRELEVDRRGREIHEAAKAVEREPRLVLRAELPEARGADVDPARRRHVDRLVAAFDAVFVLQAPGDDVELQGADRAED